jgi:hypothetical protein
MTHKGDYVLIPRTCESITLYGKRNFADVIKLRLLRRGIILDYLGEHNVITRVLINQREEVRKERRCCSDGFESGRRACEPRNVNSLWKLLRQRMDYFTEPPERTSPSSDF